MYLNLVRQMAWADATVWAAILSAPPARADAMIRRTMHHIHLVQHIFVQAWRGQPIAIRPDTEFETAESLAAYGRATHEDLTQFAANVTATALAAEFREPWTDRFEARSPHAPAATHTLEESLFQVPMHSAHHRGQVCTRLRELGSEPPTIDFIVWLWSGRPAPVWPVPVPAPSVSRATPATTRAMESA